MIKGGPLLESKKKKNVGLPWQENNCKVHFPMNISFIKQAWVALLCVGRGILAINILCIKKLIPEGRGNNYKIPKGLFSRTISTHIVLCNVWYAQRESLGTFPPA